MTKTNLKKIYLTYGSRELGPINGREAMEASVRDRRLRDLISTTHSNQRPQATSEIKTETFKTLHQS